MKIDENHKKWAERISRRRWKIKQHRYKSFWIDKIKKQKGKCALTKSQLLFNAKYGIAPCHPLYASIDHVIPGDEKNLQIVCYDINDLKSHLPQPLFGALQKTKEWKQLKLSWRDLSKKIPDKKGTFKMLIKFGKPLKFVETTKVGSGVECDVYEFVGDKLKDLGIIKIKAGCKTPLQKVLKGEKTIEGYLSGEGRLVITDLSGKQKIYPAKNGLEVEVKIGETMQWQAADNSDLEVYEICYPPYESGRFENLG